MKKPIGNPSFFESCEGKTSYPTFVEADKSLKRIPRKGRRFGTKHPGRGEVDVYRCGFCGQYHVGHSLKR